MCNEENGKKRPSCRRELPRDAGHLYRKLEPNRRATAKMETRHPIEGSFGNEFFHRSIMIAQDVEKKFNFCVFFGKNDPLLEIFQNSVPKNSSRHHF